MKLNLDTHARLRPQILAAIESVVSSGNFIRGPQYDAFCAEFAAHVGYSTPEHRAAIEARGISPLHRVSFQSAAYQQLGLEAFELVGD